MSRAILPKVKSPQLKIQSKMIKFMKKQVILERMSMEK